MYNCKFQDFLQKYNSDNPSSKLNEKVQLCIFDPPFNWNMGEYDKMDSIELDQLCQLAFHITKPGGTIMMFCGLNQFAEYQNAFKKLNLMVELNGLIVTYSTSCNYIYFNYFR